MSKRYGTPLARFHQYSNYGKDGCVLWSGPTKGGYGCFKIGKQRVLAHRYSYERYVGSIPEGMVVRHKCDTKNCVAPWHLELGTHQDNVADMDERGRRSVGENHNSKLTEEQVRAIRADDRPQRAIGADYGISHTIVGKIKRREDWAHVE